MLTAINFQKRTFQGSFNVVDIFGWTPFHLVCCSNLKGVKLFLKHAKEKGIDITKKDTYGRTARDLIMQCHGYGDILELGQWIKSNFKSNSYEK